jgi:F-type H+-transporting ATPase subunit b
VQRIRKVLLVGLVIGAALVAVPTTAHAAGDHAKEYAECIAEAQEEAGLTDESGEVDVEGATKTQLDDFDNAAEDCKKAKSLFTPALPELIWGGIAFLLVAFMLIKFAFPALKKGLKQREEKIRGDLEGAEHARQEAETERSRYQAQLADARTEANRIVEDARAAAEQVRQDAVGRADAEAAQIRARANDDIEGARERALADLRAQVADISIELAEKIVERNIDRSTQEQLIESYISSVGNK